MAEDQELADDLAEGRMRPAGPLARSSPDCVKLLDAAGCILHLSQSGLSAMEIDDFESVRGQYWASLWPAECRPLVEQSLCDARSGRHQDVQAAGGSQYRRHEGRIAPDGDLRWPSTMFSNMTASIARAFGRGTTAV